MERIFKSNNFFNPSVGEPIRSVVTETSDAVIVAWQVNPGQHIQAHVHPSGQDTWIIISGQGAYQVTASGEFRKIVAGDVVVARTGSVHGVFNTGDEPLRFISVVSPGSAGYELV